MKANQHYHLSEIDSTNTEAKRLIPLSKGPFVVSALKQLSGRGRLGNVWQSDTDTLSISFVFNWQRTNLKLFHFPYLSALIVYDYLDQFGIVDLEIKWPNDILVKGKKISGILIEMQDQTMIIGIGININQDKHYFERQNLNGTSLAFETSRIFRVETEIYNFETYFFEQFSYYQKQHLQIIELWLERCINYKRWIRCRVGTTVKTGVFEGLGSSGELLLKTDAGIETIFAGEIIECL